MARTGKINHHGSDHWTDRRNGSTEERNRFWAEKKMQQIDEL
jgi:hypothetical protein